MPLKQAAQATSTEKTKNIYKQLSLAATDLNTASDGLADAMHLLDDTLKRLNLGVSAWVTVSGNDDQDGNWWSRSIGYTQVGDKWGIALKDASGHYAIPDRDSVEKWLFNDAPRWMRVESVGRIPDLLEALLKQAEDTTKKIKAKTDEALALVQAVTRSVEEAQPAEQK
jgi:hypothetical protein